jgi:hypothetical protein
MKKSKLVQYRDFILQRLQSKISVSQIHRDLENVGCTIARSALSDWIKKTTEAEGMKLPSLKRGRPAKTKLALFSFLPPQRGQIRDRPSFLYFSSLCRKCPEKPPGGIAISF